MNAAIFYVQEAIERLDAVPRAGTPAAVYREVVAARRAAKAALAVLDGEA